MKPEIWFVNAALILCVTIQGVAQTSAAKKSASPVASPGKSQNESGGAQCSADPPSLQNCAFRTPASIEDFGNDIREFNRAMVGCFATGMTSSAPLRAIPHSMAACTNVTLADIPPAAR